jgi:hypothetical protein
MRREAWVDGQVRVNEGRWSEGAMNIDTLELRVMAQLRGRALSARPITEFLEERYVYFIRNEPDFLPVPRTARDLCADFSLNHYSRVHWTSKHFGRTALLNGE